MMWHDMCIGLSNIEPSAGRSLKTLNKLFFSLWTWIVEAFELETKAIVFHNNFVSQQIYKYTEK